MTKARLYELTAEHRAELAPWRDRWIRQAMRATPLTDDERERVRRAVVGLYAAAGLKEPRVVFVPSPFAGAFAAGFAAAIWWLRANPNSPLATRAATWAATEAATWAATEAATGAATGVATGAATWAATWAATEAATWAATRAATWAATGAATRAATWAATEAATGVATEAATEAATGVATWAATWAATGAATEAATEAATGVATWAATRAATGAATWAATWAATEAATRAATPGNWFALGGCDVVDMREVAAAFGPVGLLMSCAANACNMLDGGNQWAYYPAYLSFFRHVSKLALDYSKWDHYETAAIGGPRFMHPEFCLVSELPTRLTVDDRNRPHAEDGPFCSWADGSRLYAHHGTRVPGWVLERPGTITVAVIQSEADAEVRRVMIEKYGPSRYMVDAGAKILDVDALTLVGSAPRALFEDAHGERWLVGTDGSTGRVYHMPAAREAATCRAAHERMCGFDESRLVVES